MFSGHSAYPLKPWLLTPFLQPSTPAEVAYNSAHARTRVIVERSFGLLKSRWRCLDKTGGVLCYSPSKVCKIGIAISVLHNICIDQNLPPPPVDEGGLPPVHGQPVRPDNLRADPQAILIRCNLAQQIGGQQAH